MRHVILISAMLFVSLSVYSQNSAIIFFNKEKGKVIQVPRGGMVVLQYQGYLKQMEQETNYLISLNNSTITIGKPRMFADATDVKKIRIDDINGFRKISAGSQLLKTVLTIGATVGTYYAIRSNGDNMSYTEQLLYSTAAGLTVRFSLNKIFPENKIKYNVKEGWQMLVR